MQHMGIKEDARRLIDQLPNIASWDDLMHEIFVRQAIEAGLADSEAGHTIDVETLRAELNLPK